MVPTLSVCGYSPTQPMKHCFPHSFAERTIEEEVGHFLDMMGTKNARYILRIVQNSCDLALLLLAVDLATSANQKQRLWKEHHSSINFLPLATHLDPMPHSVGVQEAKYNKN
jgi:hypothetical protein